MTTTIDPSTMTVEEFDALINRAIDAHPDWTNPRKYGETDCLYKAENPGEGECTNCLIGYVLFVMLGFPYEDSYDVKSESAYHVLKELGFREPVGIRGNRWQCHADGSNLHCKPFTWSEARTHFHG